MAMIMMMVFSSLLVFSTDKQRKSVKFIAGEKFMVVRQRSSSRIHGVQKVPTLSSLVTLTNSTYFLIFFGIHTRRGFKRGIWRGEPAYAPLP